MKTRSSNKMITAREAVRLLPSTGKVMLPPSTGIPLGLLDALDQELDRFQNLHLYAGLIFAEHKIWGKIGENIQLTTWQITPQIQKQADAGSVEFMPLRLSQVPNVFGLSGPIPIDAVLLQCSPPDKEGFLSLGVSVCTLIDIARSAPMVIVEVNQKMPRTLGNSFIHLSEVDYVVDANYQILEHRKANIGDLEQRIAGYVADLIPDGATIQMGIGAIPEALMFSLGDKKNLGVHSGMISDGFISLIEKGTINGSKKAIDRHKVVTGEVMGSVELYSYVDQNPMIHMDSVNYTHNPLVICQLDCFVSINSAVEIDLAGQINAESIGNRQISGLGGQFDYIEGVIHSPNGVSIFAMPSTASRGKLSRIVSKLSHGASVSTPRYCAEYVVTEYGVANLQAKTMSQRREALIGIAHPDFRDELSL